MWNFDRCRHGRSLVGMLAAAVAMILLAAAPATAATVLALGASNTYGKGVSRGEDYPAQLQAMLAAKGNSARVVNAGINGDTVVGMAARLDGALTSDTRVVIFQPGGNDARKGVSAADTAAATAQIEAKLRARNIRMVTMPNSMLRPHPHQADGQHLTPEGYRGLAAAILPQVVSALGR